MMLTNQESQKRKGIFCCTPEPHVAFCPIFVHPLFPVFEPHVQKWVIFVRLWHFEIRIPAPPRKKDRIWHRLLLLPRADCDNWTSRMSRTTRGKNNAVRVFLESVAGRRPATPSHKHGSCPSLGFQPPFLLNIACRWPAMFSRKAGCLRLVEVFGVFRVFRVFKGGVLGLVIWGLAGQKRPEMWHGVRFWHLNEKKKLKTAENLKLDKNKVKSKMGFRTYN